MKNFSMLVISLLISLPVFAAGTHDGGHDGGGHDGGGHGHGEHEFSVGQPVDGEPDRVIAVSMLDTMRFEFEPGFADLHDGEVIRFDVRNDGRILHEFSIGNAAEQKAHAKMMREMHDMEKDMKHEDPNTVSLEPGESGSITWRFAGDDTVVFACNIPGHFEAGMHHDLAIKGAKHGH